MSNVAEIKQRVQRVSEQFARMKVQLQKLKGPEGEAIKKGLKEVGSRIAVGAGLSLFGVIVLIGGALYINALLIILFDLFLPLWAAALIIVLGELLLGAVLAAVGVAVIRKAVKGVPKVGGPVLEEVKEAKKEIKESVEELQALAKQEADERQTQMKDLMGQAKQVAPYVIGAYIGYRVIKGAVKARRKRRMLREELLEAL